MIRTPLALIVPLTVCAALLVGCGDDADPEVGPSGSASQTTDAPVTDPPGTDDPTDEPTDDLTGSPTDTPTDDTTEEVPPGPTQSPDPDGPTTSTGPTDPQTSTDSKPVPADAVELCDAFSTAYAAFLSQMSNYPEEDTDRVPAEFVDVLHDWGQSIRDSELPSDLSSDERAGFGLMSKLLLAIPDDATGKDLDRLDEDLSDSDDDKVSAASDWVEETCNLDY